MHRIGNYEYADDRTHFLGKGSFSEVFLGRYIGDDEKLQYDTPVAIKIIKTTNITTNARKIINDEIEIMKLIKKEPHPNIVDCYDVYQDSSKVCIIMEYCDSGSLKNIIKKPIKEKYIQFYFSQLANGLKYLSIKNIVHRDIKPRNILLTNNRRVLKIADFGFAKKIEGISLYDTICGSPLYMAPEMIRQDKYNTQTDLWSIGMILYEMLFGYHPYDNCKTIPELKDIIKTKDLEIPPSNNKNKDISDNCVSLLKKLLQKDVNKRISWDDFFNHSWINKYPYEQVKENTEYKSIICSTSLGSLSPSLNPVTQIDKLIDPVDLSISSKKIEKTQIIPDYYDTFISNKQDTQDDCIFEVELDTSHNNCKYKIKEIIDKDTVLNGNHYKIIN